MNDETMTTSTSSTPSDLADEGFEEDNNLFPEDSATLSNRPHTPANDHLNAAAPGELSPPRSQHNQSEDLTSNQQTASTSETMANGSTTRSSARLANQQPKFGGHSGQGNGDTSAFPTLGGSERDMDKPGYGWKNKKAQEEMQRAWDNIVDKDFSLKEFGDVMMQGKAQTSGQ